MFWKHSLSFISDTIKDWKFLRNLKESLKKKSNFQFFPGQCYIVNYLLNFTILSEKLRRNFQLKVRMHIELICIHKCYHSKRDTIYTSIYNFYFFWGGGNLILIIINQSKWRKYTACLKHPHENYLYYIYLTLVV